jgi:hypothetical protein
MVESTGLSLRLRRPTIGYLRQTYGKNPRNARLSLPSNNHKQSAQFFVAPLPAGFFSGNL